MALTTKPLTNAGVEVGGFDITAARDEALCGELVSMFNEHGLLLFRGQDVDPERQIAFSRVFGELEAHPLAATTSAEYPELFTLATSPEQEAAMTAYYDGRPMVSRLDWHMDLHYTGKPNRGAVLRSVVCAEEDGLTGFADMAAAYDALDDETRGIVDRIEVVYAFSVQRRHMRYVEHAGYEPGPYSPKKPSDVGFPGFPDVAYPAAVKHPVTGRRVLEIAEQFLDRVVAPHKAGLSNDEAIDLLEALVAHSRDARFHYFHEWQPGDMILWDNWRMLHCATGTKPGVKRLIHRTTIDGDVQLGRVVTDA